MAFAIPLQPSIPRYRLSTSLDGVPYIFDVHWNDRDQAWYFDLLEVDESPIIHGVKVVLGTYLGRRSTHQFFRDGVLVVTDLSGEGRDAGLDDLGARVQMVRYSALEVATLRGLVPA